LKKDLSWFRRRLGNETFTVAEQFRSRAVSLSFAVWDTVRMATRRDQLYAMTHAERVEHVRKAWSTDLGQAPGKFQTALEAKGIELQVERGLER